MDKATYAEESQRLLTFSAEQQLAVFEHAVRARERPLRTLFGVAMAADIEQGGR